jgi:hypothetical protein
MKHAMVVTEIDPVDGKPIKPTEVVTADANAA